jgi:ribosomal protein L21E
MHLMLIYLKRSALLFAFLVALSLVTAPCAFAVEPSEEAAQKALHTIMDAIRDGDYKAFIKPASPSFKKAMPEDRFHRLFGEVGPVLKKGYKTESVADYPEDGRQVYIWKITPKAVVTELGAILVLESKTGEVASFDLQ